MIGGQRDRAAKRRAAAARSDAAHGRSQVLPLVD
jgi:hypothetical protein